MIEPDGTRRSGTFSSTNNKVVITFEDPSIKTRTITTMKKKGKKSKGPKMKFGDAIFKIALEACPTVAEILALDMRRRKVRKVKVWRKDRVEIEEEDKDGGKTKSGKAKTVKKTKTVKWQEEIDSADNVVVLKGYVQSGKTNFMISTAVAKMAAGESTIIVLRRNLGDMLQIKSRIRQFNEAAQEVLKGLGFRKAHIPYEIEYLDSEFDLNDFQRAMSGEQPRIFVVLGNPAQLKRMNTGLRTLQGQNADLNYNVAIDECDLMDSEGTGTAKELEPLKFNANMVLLVSATIMDNVMKEYVKSGRLIMLPRPDMTNKHLDYRSIETYDKFRYIAPTAKPCNKMGDDPFEKDPGLATRLTAWARKKPTYVCGQMVPQMMLMNIGKVTLPQQLLFDWLRDTLGVRVVAILFNGEGLKASHAKLPRKPITINTITGPVTSTYDKKQKVHTFKKMGVADFYQWLKNNGGAVKWRRIVTIAGNLASRGLSFTSADYGKFIMEIRTGTHSPSVVGWSTQTLYYLASGTTDQPELIQNAGRVCVIAARCARYPITVITARETKQAIINAFWAQEDLINQAEKRMAEEKERYFIRAIPKVPFYCGKVAKGHKFTKKVACPINTVTDPRQDEGKSIDEYDYDKAVERRKANGTFGRKEEKVVERLEAKSGNGDGQGMARIVSLYRTKPGSYVALIIKAFVSQEFESLSAERIREVTGKPKMNLTNYDRWGGHAKYKVLDKIDNGNYNLRAEVLEACNLA
jgi:hypothetical protein